MKVDFVVITLSAQISPEPPKICLWYQFTIKQLLTCSPAFILLYIYFDLVCLLAVDLLEEVVSDDEDVPKKGRKGQKRKR